jgi:5'-nucleotidase/UDP-sugar diphosphatase
MTVLLLTFSGGRAYSEQEGPDFQITILHTNDLHSHDLPFTEFGKSVGGLTRIGHLIRMIRKKEPNCLVVDAGDIFQGTPLFQKYRGEVEVHMLNEIGYDLFTIGNHEFDEGLQNLADQLKKAKFQIISANLDCSQYHPMAEMVKPSIIKEVGGQKIGFVGADTPDLEALCLPENLQPLKLKSKGADWYQPIKQEVEKLKAEGVNKIIILSHCGLDKEKEMGKNIPDVDVVIGGHSHSRLDHAEVFEHPGTGTTLVVQTGSYGRALGELNLAFDKEGRLIFPATNYHLINITDKIYEDADLKSYVEEKQQPLMALRKEILGTAETDFDNRWANFTWDSPLGDLVADAVYNAGKKYGATISFENRGGIRARIEKGDITAETVEEMLPFDNRLTVGTVSGDVMLKNLEHSVSYTGGGGKFFDEHGLKLAYDCKGEPGHRLVFVLAQDKDGSWRPVDPAAKYRIAVNSYSFSGGESYDFSKAEDVNKLPDKMSQVFREYLKVEPKHGAGAPSRIAPVVATLLRPEKKGEAVKLHVHSDTAEDKIYLLTGEGLGVESIRLPDSERELPVPLSKPRIIHTTSANGQTDVDLDAPPASEVPAVKERKGKDKKLVVVVVEPAKGSHGKIQVSAPVDLNALSN